MDDALYRRGWISRVSPLCDPGQNFDRVKAPQYRRVPACGHLKDGMRPLPCDTNQLICRLVRGFTSKEGGVNRYCSGHSQEPLDRLQHHAKRQDRRGTLTLILPILVNGKHSGARPLSKCIHSLRRRRKMVIARAKAEITNCPPENGLWSLSTRTDRAVGGRGGI